MIFATRAECARPGDLGKWHRQLEQPGRDAFEGGAAHASGPSEAFQIWPSIRSVHFDAGRGKDRLYGLEDDPVSPV